MKFYDAKMFYLLGFALLGAALYLRLHYKNKAKMKRLGNEAMVKAMCGSVSAGRRFLRIFLRLTAMALLVVALARPKGGLRTDTVQREGIDVIVALDVSASMLAKDIAPNRFERAKLELYSLLEKLENDRVGLTLFSGVAFVQMPLTLDYSAARLFIRSAEIDTLPKPGTVGASAIKVSLDALGKSKRGGKAIVIFTDGEFHDDALKTAVKEARDAKVAIYAIGFGTETGAPIPVQKGEGIIDFKKDKDGSVVLSKQDKGKLAQITEATGGKYYNASDSNVVDKISDSFSNLEKTSQQETIYSQGSEQFEMPLALSFLLLLAESAISERKKESGRSDKRS